jgi:hypothetical protein
MIRTLSLTDIIPLTNMPGTDWAINPSMAPIGGQRSLFSPADFFWNRFRSRRKSGAWVSLDKGRINGLVSARACSGPTAWMIDHMITVSNEQNPCSDLLEAAAIHAGRHEAQRLLLNIPNDWHCERMVRSSGFFHCMRVLLCTLQGRSPLLSVAPENGFRPCTYADAHSLFQLYNATTTTNTRDGIGLTFEQWKDSQEPLRRGAQEFTMGHPGQTKVWLRLEHHKAWTSARLSIHPNSSQEILPIVAFVLKETGSRSICWEIPEEHESIRLLLERVGFEVTGAYHVMAKHLAIRIKTPAMTPMAISD